MDIEHLIEVHEARIRAFCARRLAPHLVDDAVAETFATVWRKRDRVPVGDGAVPWLYAVAYRVVQHSWRSSGRQARLHDRLGGVPACPAEDGATQLVAREEHRLALVAAASLGDDDREILRLTLWEELSPTEAGAVLGISPDAAKQRASRARRRLGDAYRRLQDDPATTTSRWARPTTIGEVAP